MREILIAMTMFMLFSCKKDQCPDKDYLSRIEAYIHTFENDYSRGDPLAGDVLEANLFLVELTDVESKANYGDVSTYMRHADYKMDLKSWKKWYNEHRCDITLEQLNQVEKKIEISTYWIRSK